MTDLQAQTPQQRRKPEERDRILAGMGAAAIVGAAAAHLAGRYVGGSDATPSAAPSPADSLDVFDTMLARAGTGQEVIQETPSVTEPDASPEYPADGGEYRASPVSGRPVGTTRQLADAPGPATQEASREIPRAGSPPVPSARPSAGPSPASPAIEPAPPAQSRGADLPTNSRPPAAASPPHEQPTSPNNPPSTSPQPVTGYPPATPPTDGGGAIAGEQVGQSPAAGTVDDQGALPPGAGTVDDHSDTQNGQEAPVEEEEVPFSSDLDLPENLVITRLSPTDFYRLVQSGELDGLMRESLETTGIPVTPVTMLGLFNAVAPLHVARRYDGDGDDALDSNEAAILIRDIVESESFADWLAPQPDNAAQVGAGDARHSVDDTYEQIERGLWADGASRDLENFGIWATDRAARAVVERYDRNADGIVSGEEAYLLFLEQRLYGSAAEWATAITSDETLLSDYVLPPAGSNVYEGGVRLSPEIFMQVEKSGLARYEPEPVPDRDGERVPERWRAWVEEHAPQDLIDAYSGADGMLSGDEAVAMRRALYLAGWDYGTWETNYANGPSYSAETLHGPVSTGQWANELGVYGKMGPSPTSFALWLEHSTEPTLVRKYDRNNDGHLSEMEAELLRRELVSYESPAAYAAAINSNDVLPSEYVLRQVGEGLPPLSLDLYLEIERRGLVSVSPDEPNGFTGEFRVTWLNREAPAEVVAAYAGPDGTFDAEESDVVMEALRDMGPSAWKEHLYSYRETGQGLPSAAEHRPPSVAEYFSVLAANPVQMYARTEAPPEVKAAFDRDGDGELSRAESEHLLASLSAVGGDVALWESALHKSPLPGHDARLSMEEVYEAVKHRQLAAVVDAYAQEQGEKRVLTHLLPPEILRAVDPDGTGNYDPTFLDAAGERVREGMGYQQFLVALDREIDQQGPDAERAGPVADHEQRLSQGGLEPSSMGDAESGLADDDS